MATILITGGSGMIGSALTKPLLLKGHKVIVLSRNKKQSSDSSLQYKQWDIEKATMDEAAIAEADYIVHLAGANVAEKRWSEKRKKEIVDSRVKSGDLLMQSLRKIPNKVKAIVAASAIGWYGPDPQIPNPNPFIETDPPAKDFLGHACQLWEKAIQPAKELGKRVVTFRIGIVLSNDGGAYPEFKKPLQFGVATVLGNGKQVVSWIHVDDLIRLFVTAIEDEKLNGVYNAVTPQPVSNKELIIAIAKQRDKFYVPVPVPSIALKLAMGEMSVEVLKSTTVSDHKITATGFKFLYPAIAEAVKKLQDVKS